MENEAAGFAAELLDLPLSPRIGQGGDRSTTPTFEMKLQPTEALVLYTDGLFSVTLADGKTLSDRRLGKKLSKKFTSEMTAEGILQNTLSEFDEFRGTTAPPDDVSVVVLRRTLSHSLSVDLVSPPIAGFRP